MTQTTRMLYQQWLRHHRCCISNDKDTTDAVSAMTRTPQMPYQQWLRHHGCHPQQWLRHHGCRISNGSDSTDAVSAVSQTWHCGRKWYIRKEICPELRISQPILVGFTSSPSKFLSPPLPPPRHTQTFRNTGIRDHRVGSVDLNFLVPTFTLAFH
jgi:hypothetical protein